MLLEDIYGIIYSYLQFIYNNLKPIEQKQITPQIHMYSLFLLRGINIGFKGNETN
jgi:hypothetical protein